MEDVNHNDFDDTYEVRVFLSAICAQIVSFVRVILVIAVCKPCSTRVAHVLCETYDICTSRNDLLS